MDYGMDILVRNFMERISRYSRPNVQAHDLNPNVQYHTSGLDVALLENSVDNDSAGNNSAL